MSKRKSPNQQAFDKLLLWLDPDRDQAGEKYEKIRLRLIKIFASRGCLEAEDLADETVNVVCSQIDWLLENYDGDPARYFYGVAKKIYLEHRKKKPPPKVPPPDRRDPVLEAIHDCLEKCLEELSPVERDLVLRYQGSNEGSRIEERKKLAEELGITRNALRIRVFHIHARLEDCTEDCLQHHLIN